MNTIDRDLLAGQPQATIARKFGLSVDCVNRHYKHLQKALVLGVQAQHNNGDLRYGSKLLAEISRIRADAERLQEETEHRQDYRAALAAVRERLAIVELEAKLAGAIKPAQNVTVNITAEPLETTLNDAKMLLELHGYIVQQPSTPPQVIEGVVYQHPQWCHCERCQHQENSNGQVLPPASQ